MASDSSKKIPLRSKMATKLETMVNFIGISQQIIIKRKKSIYFQKVVRVRLVSLVFRRLPSVRISSFDNLCLNLQKFLTIPYSNGGVLTINALLSY
jgi:hypothetical protein